MSTKQSVYTIGVPAYWATLIPPLQHSLVGDGVIEHQFDPLIRMGEKGITEPLTARSWEFSEDRRILRFKIDTSRRFSDGSNVRAEDFKESWEDGLRMDPKSANSSLSDGLGNIKGFSEFAEKGTIDGIRVIGEDTLELTFDKPVRLVLEHLAGGRFSVYKMKDGLPIGTGPYIISEKDKVLTLTQNPYYTGPAAGLKIVKIIVTPPDVALEKFRSGEIDAFLFAETASLPGCLEGKLAPIQCAYGQEGGHMIAGVNGLRGRFFSDPEHRLAFQALILKNISQAEAAFSARGFMRDDQSFLKFQSGRIPEDQAQEIIKSGEKYIQRFIKAAQEKPLYLAAASRGWQWIIDCLLANGVKLSEKSRVDFTAAEFWEMYYKTFEPDIMPMGASVSDGDPDGLYHLLGRQGAIFSPILERQGTCDGMENGRDLLDFSRLPGHYQDISKKILKEVPFVHLGYLYRRIAYNADRLTVSEPMISRNNVNILALEPR